MNTLILSCNTGEGHNSCAKAVKECFALHGQSCRVEDALRFISRGTSRFISRWHVRLYRYMPKLYGAGYRFSEKHPRTMDQRSLLYRLMGEGAEALYGYICKNRIDTVICPHVFSAMMVTELLKKYPKLTLKSCFIATDYTLSPGTETIELDWLFVPDKAIVRGHLSERVRPEQVVESGIPVRQTFWSSVDKKLAKRRLGYDEEGEHLLLMCGSMGCGPMRRLAALLAGRLKGRQHVTIVCGTNRKLRRWMERTFYGRGDIDVLGYAENISLLMDSADLYLTKPGGISTSEAAAKALPMVLVDAVAGCEGYNLDYFVKSGLAVTAGTPESLAELCTEILSDPQRLAAMHAAGLKRPRMNAAELIYARLSGEGYEKEGSKK